MAKWKLKYGQRLKAESDDLIAELLQQRNESLGLLEDLASFCMESNYVSPTGRASWERAKELVTSLRADPEPAETEVMRFCDAVSLMASDVTDNHADHIKVILKRLERLEDQCQHLHSYDQRLLSQESSRQILAKEHVDLLERLERLEKALPKPPQERMPNA